SHHDRVFDRGVVPDVGSNPDHGIGNVAVYDDARLRDEGVLNVGAFHFGRRQHTGVRVDRHFRAVHVELRSRPQEIHVGVEKRPDRPNVTPVPGERIAYHAVLADGIRYGLVPEVVVFRVQVQRFAQYVCIENVDPHRRQVDPADTFEIVAHGTVLTLELVQLRLLVELSD